MIIQTVRIKSHLLLGKIVISMSKPCLGAILISIQSWLGSKQRIPIEMLLYHFKWLFCFSALTEFKSVFIVSKSLELPTEIIETQYSEIASILKCSMEKIPDDKENDHPKIELVARSMSVAQRMHSRSAIQSARKAGRMTMKMARSCSDLMLIRQKTVSSFERWLMINRLVINDPDFLTKLSKVFWEDGEKFDCVNHKK